MHRWTFAIVFAALILALSVGAAVTSTSSPPGTAEAATGGSQKITGVVKGTYHLSFTDYVQTYDAVTTADIVWEEDNSFLGAGCHCRTFFPTGNIDWSFRYHTVYNETDQCTRTVGGQVPAGTGLQNRGEQMLVLWDDVADPTKYVFSSHGGMNATDGIDCSAYGEGIWTAQAIDFTGLPGPDEISTSTPAPLAVRAQAASGPLCDDLAPIKVDRDAARITGSCYDMYIDDGYSLEYVKYEWDLQINPEPVVFIHGLMGSQIMCGSEELWPHVNPRLGIPPYTYPQLAQMALADDGVSPATGACAATVGDLIRRVLIVNVYGPTMDFLNQLEPPGNVEFFNWDWRKSPQESLALLDAKIQSVRAAHQNSKVVIMAHSYGGLLARLYLDNAGYRENVARVVTIGTPAWGAPSALFPLSHGVKGPGDSMNGILQPPADLHELARNLTGNYYLYPSASYGPWLQVGPYTPPPLNQQGVLDYVTSLGGNAALLSQAFQSHAGVLDSPYVGTSISDPKFEIIVGTGLPTVTGIQVIGDGYVKIKYGTGDKTVPAKSGARGALDASNPNKARTHYVCGVDHVALPGNSQVTDAIDDFLRYGDPIDGLRTTGCTYGGVQLRVFRLPSIAAVGAGAGLAPTTTGAMSLDDAVLNGLVDYLDFPNEKFIITGGEIPEIALPLGAFLEVTPLSEEAPDGKGPPTLYGPLSGQVTVSVGPGGPVINVDGQPAPLYGDMNCDAQVTTTDAFLLLLHFVGTPQSQPSGCPEIGSGSPPFGDLNCDNRVTVGDVLAALLLKDGNAQVFLRRCQ